MGAGAIFNGNFIKLLKNNLKLGENARVLTGTDDPQSVAQDAEKGSLYLRQTPAGNGAAYVKEDDGSSTNWTGPLDVAGGGGGGGGGSSITTVKRGEATIAGDLVYQHEKPYITISASNQYIDFDEGGGELVATVANAQYLTDTEENINTFLAAVKTALDAAGGQAYTVSLETTGLVRISAGSTFSILWKTGTHGSDNSDDHIGTALGYDDTADDASATSHDADNDLADSYLYEVFWMLADADYQEKSDSAFGYDNDGGAKLGTATVNTNSPFTSYSGLTIADIYTASGSIVIQAGVNDALDFNEGGAEFNATITAGSYAHPYDDLLADIKTQMEALGAANYTISYSNDDDKITIASDGATLNLLWNTGTNTATTIGGSLGFSTAADDTGSTSYEADSRVDLRGKITDINGSTYVDASRFIGFAYSSSEAYVFRNSGEDYFNVIQSPNLWLSEPIKQDASGVSLLIDQDERPNGEGIRLWMDNPTSTTSTYTIEYKTGKQEPWQTATTSIAHQFAGVGHQPGNNWDGTLGDYKYGYCKIDPDRKVGIIALCRSNNGVARGEIYTSTDLDTWTSRSSFAGSVDHYFGMTNIVIRNDKAFMAMSNGNAPGAMRFFYSDLSAGDYTSWTQTHHGTSICDPSYPMFAEVQYYPLETGANQYRFMVGYTDYSTTQFRFGYTKGDNSGWNVVNSQTPIASARHVDVVIRDREGNANKTIFLWSLNSGAGANEMFGWVVDDSYNGGTPIATNSSGTDIVTFAKSPTRSSGKVNSANTLDASLTKNKNGVMIGDRAYFVWPFTDTPNAPTYIDMIVMYTDDVDNFSWSNKVIFDGQSVSDFAGGAQMRYIQANDSIVIVWKVFDAWANVKTEGQLWASTILNASTANPIFTDAIQIDGGEVIAGFQGPPSLSANIDTANVSWEYDDTVNEDLWQNKFI